MASPVSEQAASNILNLQSPRKPPTRNRQVEELDRLWLNLEKQIAHIPLDKDGSTLQDEDEVQISQQLLAMDDAPFDYCLKGFYDADEFPKWISRRQSIQTRVKSLKTLLRKWVEAFPASDMEHWCKLPAMLRYALKRPLMPQRDLENKLKELGFCVPPLHSSMMRAESKALSSREQKLLLGIDIDGLRPGHQSAQYHDIMVNGWLPPDQNIEVPEARTTQDTGPGADRVGDRKAQDEEDLHRQIQATYTLFQKGTSDIGEAIDGYRYFLGAPNISENDLACRLEDFGIPKEHIMRSKTEFDQATLHESLQQTYKLLHGGQMGLENAIIRYRYLLDQPIEPLSDLATRLEEFGLPREHMFRGVCKKESPFSEPPAEVYELKIVEDVRNLVLAYRSGHFKLDEAVSSVSERLEGLKIDQPCFSRLISSEDLTPTQVAQAIFESAAEESQPSSPIHQIDPDVSKTLDLIAERCLDLYDERIADGLDPGIALAEYREEFKLDYLQPHEVSFILAQLQGPEDSVQEVSGTTTTSELDSPIDKGSGILSSSMPPPELRTSRERSRRLGSETLVRSKTPGQSSIATLCDNTAAQEPNLAVAEWEQSFSGTAGNPEHRDYDELSSSPEHGYSTDLWGLELPTATAKKLALDIGLPTDYVDRRIHSLTPTRINSTKARKMGSSTRSSSIKRKASVTVHQGRRIRSFKHPIDLNESAKEVRTYDASVQGKPDTILEYLELIVLEIGIFRVDLPMDSGLYKAAIREIASKKIAEIATEIKRGSVRPIRSHTERCLMALLRDIESDPKSFNVCSLTASIQHGLQEVAELAKSCVPTNELSTKARQGTPASLRPPASSVNRDPKPDISSIFKGILTADPCPHKPPSRQIDLYELYSGKQGLLRDARFVTQLFVCPECSKPNGNEPLSFIEPMERPQPLRLTKPKKRQRIICHNDDLPFIGTPKDMSYSAVANCQSFFVGLEMRRRQRPKANLSATNDRYFQNPISSPSSSGSTSQLNKLFEKYKGNPTLIQSIILLGLMRLRQKNQIQMQTPSASKVQCAISVTWVSSLMRSFFLQS